MKIWWGVLAAALLGLTACDAVRYPGDGHEDDYQAETPPGAPGPAPPSEPVRDPYGDGDSDTTTPPVTDNDGTETPDTQSGEPSDLTPPGEETDTGEPDAETTAPDEPDAGTPDTGSDLAETETTPPAGDDTSTGEPDTGDTPADTGTVETGSEEDDSGSQTGSETGDTTSPDDGDTTAVELGEADDGTLNEAGDTETETPPGDTTDTTDTADGSDASAAPEPTIVFSYFTPGHLIPGSGTGANDRETVFSPEMRFPIKSDPAYLQSQVWSFGGGVKGGDQCDPRNYEYPWRDNFCETRSANRNSPYCPVARIHQGQDIRVGTAEGCNQMRRTAAADRAMYDVVAVEDGVIQSIGTYTVTLRAGPRIYKYMHMNMRALQVSEGDTVTKGQKLGYVSNDFGGTPTTFHLHFEMLQNTAESGWVHVPPYTSLEAAYERRENGIGEKVEPNVAVASAPVPDILRGPDAPKITEGFVVVDESIVPPPVSDDE